MIELITKVRDQQILQKAALRFKEKKILLPTFAQQRDPINLVPKEIKDQLQNIGLWDLHPLNLFRITWHNEPKKTGGLYGPVNYIEIPQELSGVKARIIMLIGKWFPTGAHKVGAAYGCLVPRLITGEFDPTYHKAVWPSTGNYCRGGAFDSKLMDVHAIAILPEEMSRERFEWLRDYVQAEVIATPGCESNVKEIYDKVWELRENCKECVIFNQFDEFGNAVWHYTITGPAAEEVFNLIKDQNSNLAAFVSATGSAGTIATGDYLRTKFPFIKIIASEALQCPTLYMNGFGGHRIEGIGDKHVPWIHNVKNTDVITAIDDEDTIRLMRLFNEPEGKKFLVEQGIDQQIVSNLHLLGISSIANLLSAIKTAKYFELTQDDIIITVATDSMELYQSRLLEQKQIKGEYNYIQAAKDFEKALIGQQIDYLKELTYQDRKTIHNLKYYTWIEQQKKELEDLNQLWYDKNIWQQIFSQTQIWDELIDEFNKLSGMYEYYGIKK